LTIFKCKMCGGDLEVDQSMAVGTCQHCGSTMTLPKASDERIANLFNRANHYRRSSEFDKALKVYESILNEDDANAEAYWGLVLCRYGIEYVEDPKSGQRIPTCHRAQKTSIFMDADYKQAIEYADETARALYKAEAATTDAIQKQILAISEQVAPYDIFICYKETSETGSRTKDSVLAQDIYHHLTEVGYKVFFSKISLEDKLGSAYEPSIFAALNSSPVMIVVATSTENVNAVWTKNEWSRYLALINKGEKKTLIPVYRDIEAYDLPEEFSHLQALDMSKLGFMQDLIRGVKKMLESGAKPEQKSETTPASESGATTQSLLKRAFICLEDGEWAKADELLERALDVDPENSRAYIGKLLIELQVKEVEALAEQTEPFSQSKNYEKALRFADEHYKKLLLDYNTLALQRRESVEQIEKILKGGPLYIDFGSGTITLEELPIGAKVIDTSWVWEFQAGNLFRRVIVKPITWIIVAKNHYEGLEPHVTMITEELIGLYPFDNSSTRGSKHGSNHWGNSGMPNATFGLRPWLNSTDKYALSGFYQTFSDSFKEAVLETTVPNGSWNSDNTYSTNDKIFLPSTTEIGDSGHELTCPIGNVYPYFRGIIAKDMVVCFQGNAYWYWTRSPSSSYCDSVRYVNFAGGYSGNYASNRDVGVRPALNLKSGTLVTSIK
jgi:tetratricopeptide (TPR) repeat protein